MKQNLIEHFLISKKRYILTALLALHLILAITSVYNDSLTWDEKCYAGLGRYVIETGNLKISGLIHHAPLSFYMNSIFLFFIDLPDYIWDMDSCWDIGNSIVFNSGHNPQKIVFLIRLPFILLSLLLAFYIYRWAKELYGTKAGLFALFIYSLSPSIMSTSRLAMTDFPVVVFIFISTYYLWRLNKNKTTKNAIKTGVFTGLALASKVTAIYLIPIFIILSLFGLNKKNIKIKVVSLLAIFAIAALVVFIFYGFQFQTVESTLPDHYKERAYQEIDKNFDGGNWIKKTGLFFFEKIPVPAANYLSSLGTAGFYSTTGFKGYLLGKVYDTGKKPWHYFIIVILVKTPLPTLIFLFLSIYFFSRIRSKNILDELFLILPAILLFLPLMLNQISIDLRHILTIYPFSFVFISKAVNLKFKRKWLWNFSFTILLLGYLISTLAIYPYYIAYFNELVGRGNGHKVLLGANIDAGQDLIRLKNYLDKNSIEKINFSVHGAIDPKNYGIDYDYMPNVCFSPINTHYQPYAANCKEYFTEDCSKRKGIVAISVTNLQNRLLRNTSCYDWLKDYTPVEKIGYSIFVYNITD